MPITRLHPKQCGCGISARRLNSHEADEIRYDQHFIYVLAATCLWRACFHVVVIMDTCRADRHEREGGVGGRGEEEGWGGGWRGEGMS